MDDCLIEAELTPKRKVLREWVEWSFICEPGMAVARRNSFPPVAHEHTFDELLDDYHHGVITDMMDRLRSGKIEQEEPEPYDPPSIRKRLIVATGATKDMFANKPRGLGIGRYYSESIDDGSSINEEAFTPPRLVYSFEET